VEVIAQKNDCSVSVAQFHRTCAQHIYIKQHSAYQSYSTKRTKHFAYVIRIVFLCCDT